MATLAWDNQFHDKKKKKQRRKVAALKKKKKRKKKKEKEGQRAHAWLDYVANGGQDMRL
jgi:hypothetical protein